MTKVMDLWLGLGKEVHVISIICNDQTKQDDGKIAKYKNHMVTFMDLWKPYIG